MNDKSVLFDWVEKIKKTNLPIIVEGQKDERALRALGAKRIVRLSKKPLFAIAEDVAAIDNKVIILTDFDKKGKELYGRLSELFDRLGVQVDLYFRDALQNHTPISHVEGLCTFLQTKEVI